MVNLESVPETLDVRQEYALDETQIYYIAPCTHTLLRVNWTTQIKTPADIEKTAQNAQKIHIDNNLSLELNLGHWSCWVTMLSTELLSRAS